MRSLSGSEPGAISRRGCPSLELTSSPSGVSLPTT
nr:MAG TPA: hypothetical protein [Caudoviricetes sp.]